MNNSNMLNFISPKNAIFKKEYLESQMRLVSVIMTSDQQKIINKLISTFLRHLIGVNAFKRNKEINILALNIHDPFLELICSIFDQYYPECTLRVRSYDHPRKKNINEFKYYVDRLQLDEAISCDLCSSYVALSEDLVHSYGDGLF